MKHKHLKVWFYDNNIFFIYILQAEKSEDAKNAAQRYLSAFL